MFSSWDDLKLPSEKAKPSLGKTPPSGPHNPRKTALRFIVLMGIVSLFGDITYEGARSITGPFLGALGASAAMVGVVAGAGEFMGYFLRLASGHFSDRTRAYWPITIVGYALLCSIPLLAFAGSWQIAGLLIISERIGKGIRTPARDAILSHATKQVGRGLGFGIHEALDQIGAMIGPLMFSAVFLLKGGYRQGFSILWLPALLCIAILIVARMRVPSSAELEVPGRITARQNQGKCRVPKTFWFYGFFTGLSVAGFASFQIISFHFKRHGIVSDTQIPIFYAVAMGVDALVALVIGKTYDKIGFISLITAPLLTIPMAFLAFSQNFGLALISAVLWGAVMAIHETIMRAAVADLIPLERRGTAYGIFNTIYGAAWFLGCAVMGVLYDSSIHYLIAFVVIVELASLPLFFLMRNHAAS